MSPIACAAPACATSRSPGCDTLAREDQFFSYRRTTLRKEPDYGRQISAILLTG